MYYFGIFQYVCRAIVLIYNYIQVSNFFWMLVEGLYLHTIIVWAFAVERVRFWKYALLGWGKSEQLFTGMICIVRRVHLANCHPRQRQILKPFVCNLDHSVTRAEQSLPIGTRGPVGLVGVALVTARTVTFITLDILHCLINFGQNR